MENYKVRLIKQDSKRKDRIVDVQLFKDRKDADNFVKKKGAVPMVWKTKPKKLYYELSIR